MPLDGLKDAVRDALEDIQSSMYRRALALRDANTHEVADYDGFKARMQQEISGFVQAGWCGSEECEAAIQEETKATIRCIPLDGPEEPGRCVRCGEPSERRVVMAKAY